MFKFSLLVITAMLLVATGIQARELENSGGKNRHCRVKEAVNEVFFATHCSMIKVKGSVDFFNINSIFNLNNSRTTFDILATADGIVKRGVFTVSSTATAPIDPVTGINFEAQARILKVRTFVEYPDVVALYGVIEPIPNTNFVILPSDSLPPGTNRKFSLAVPGAEIVGLVRKGQRTNFLSTFENQNLDVANPNPAGVPITINGIPLAEAFCTASLEQLMTLVGGFQKVQQFGVLTIKTTGESVCTR